MSGYGDVTAALIADNVSVRNPVVPTENVRTDDRQLSRRDLLKGLAAGGLIQCFSGQSRADPGSTKDSHMRHIFVTGSTEGLGLAAARTLMAEGHEVVLHARSSKRAAALADIAPRSAGVVIGDLSSAVETRALADQVNKIGRMDAVIHNAGIYLEPNRGTTPEGHAKTLAVNTLAPYMLTALIERPNRLIYLSSSMHRGADGSLRDIDWAERRWEPSRAYSESKLYLTALALAVARRWPDVLSNAVDPGWVPTKMGGPSATDDLTMGYLTQTWLAVSNDPAAKVSGGYWYHRKQQKPATEALDPNFQDRLTAKLAELTGISLF
jgi:NAD(P)-dependent dehydrogenase (short-subunit alcohol dehydrogenase family)